MTLNQFVDKWLGGRVDYDNRYEYQCADLIKQYLDDCFGLKPGAWGNAVDYWLNPNPAILKLFTKVVPKNNKAQAGDIVIYTPVPSNKFGHIGVALNTTQMLDQNGGGVPGATGKGNDAILKHTIKYDRVYGYLRPKSVQSEQMETFKDSHDVRVNGFNLFGIDIAGNDPALVTWTGKPKLDFFKGLGAQVVGNLTAKDKEIARLNKIIADSGGQYVPVDQLYVKKG